MTTCDECKYREIIGHNKFCRWHSAYIGWHGCENGERKPITYADRIRAMSDEELCDEYFRILNHELRKYTDSRAGLLDWLKQEAKDA